MCENCELNDYQKQHGESCTCTCENISVGYFIAMCNICYHTVARTKTGLGLQYVDTKRI